MACNLRVGVFSWERTVEEGRKHWAFKSCFLNKCLCQHFIPIIFHWLNFDFTIVIKNICSVKEDDEKGQRCWSASSPRTTQSSRLFYQSPFLKRNIFRRRWGPTHLRQKSGKNCSLFFSFLIISSEKMSCFHCIIWGKRGIGGNCSWKLWSLYKWFLILRNCVDASCTQQPISTFQTPPAPFQWVPSTKYQPTPLWSTLPPLISDWPTQVLTDTDRWLEEELLPHFKVQADPFSTKFSHLDESCAQIKEFETPPCMEAQQW